MFRVVCQADIQQKAYFNKRLTPAMDIVLVQGQRFAIEQRTIFLSDGFDEEVAFFF